MEMPPPKYFRLKPGGEVRLKYAYIIKCDEVVKDARQRHRTALHRRSRQQNRRRRPQPQDQGHDPLGQRRARHRRRSAALRPALHGCRSRTQDGRDFKSVHQPALARNRHREVRAALERREAGIALSIRAARLFRARSRLAAGPNSFSIAPSPCATPGRKK